MLSLGPIAFVTPWILLALLLLPLLWWLLRVTPPAPRQVRFPAIRLLFGLISREKTPDSSPLWLILLRLAMVAAFILAMAHPLINPGDELPGQGPVLLVVDDGWAAAPNWSARQAALRQTIAQAEREGRGTVLVTTAPSGASEKPTITGVLKPSEARGAIDQLRPKPWPTDRKTAIASIDGLNLGENKLVLWLSDGLDGPSASTMAEALLRQGRVRVFTDAPDRLPKILLPPDALESTLTATVRRGQGGGAETAAVRAYAEDGRPLSRAAVSFKPGETEATAQIELPVELRNEVTRIAIEQQDSAAAVTLLDERWRRRPVGLISDRPLDSGPSLLNETYYIERALRPFSDLKHGGVASLLKSGRAVIIWPDEHAMVATDMAALTTWIEDGGLLLRFAGPRLARDIDDTLTPVRLRRGGRDLGGVLLWSQPARLTPFSEESPFRGLVIPPDVTISRQVLAEPSLDLAAKTWARLSDGTPLVTQERRGKGRLVLIHTTANTAWTNLPLSGLFIQLMRRILTTSRGVDADKIEKRPLPPLETLNGFGQASKPDADATAIPAGAFAKTKSSPRHPPGYYGFGDTRRAMNLSPQIDSLAPLRDLPAEIKRQAYVNAEEFDLKPSLLIAALLLLLADIIASLALRGILRDALSMRGLRTFITRGAAVGIIIFAGALLVAYDGERTERRRSGRAGARGQSRDTARLCRHRRQFDRQREQGRPYRPYRRVEPAHGGGSRRADRRGCRRRRIGVLCLALLADIRRTDHTGGGHDRETEPLSAKWRHDPVRHARSDGERRVHQSPGAGIATDYPRSQSAAARTGAAESCADEGILSDAGFSGPLVRQPGLGRTRQREEQRRRFADHRRQS